MKTEELKNLFKEFGKQIKFEHDLKKKNWFKGISLILKNFK